MAKKPTKSAKPARDIKEIVGFIRTGRLEGHISELDASDVLGTVDKVPHSIVRLLFAILTESDPAALVAQLGATSRKPLEKLLELSKKHNADKFVAALVREGSSNKTISDRLGISLASDGKGHTATFENAITSIDVRPELMLQNSQLYCSVAMFREDEMLFRSDLELGDLLWLARGLLNGAASTLKSLVEKAPGAEVKVNLARCERELKQIRSHARELPSLFAKLPSANGPGSNRTPRTRKKSKKQPRLGAAPKKAASKKKKKRKTRS